MSSLGVDGWEADVVIAASGAGIGAFAAGRLGEAAIGDGVSTAAGLFHPSR